MKKIVYSKDSLKYVVDNHEFTIYELVSPGNCNTTSGIIVIFDYDIENDFENEKIVDYILADDLIFKLGTNLNFGEYEITDQKLEFMSYDISIIEKIVDQYLSV